MLSTGNQLRAARALASMDQATLVKRSGISANTVGAMERRGAAMLASSLSTVMAALENADVEFLSDGGPGVRLRSILRRAVNHLGE